MKRKLHHRHFIFAIFLTTSFVIGHAHFSKALAQTPYQMNLSPANSYLLLLVNNERASYGLKLVIPSSRLMDSAAYKCSDMVERNYWGHITPEGKGPERFIQKAGLKTFSKAGENLAIGEHSIAEVNQDWLNSPPHRQIILDPDYSQIGFAECTYRSNVANLHPMTIYVEHFLKP